MFELFDYLNFNKKEYMCGVPLMKIIHAISYFLKYFVHLFEFTSNFHNVGGGSWNTGTATICEYQPLQWNSDSGCHKYSYRSVAEHCLTLTFLTYVTQLLSKSVSVKLSQIVSRSVSQSQLDCQDHITRTVRWFWFARRAEGSQRLRLDLDDYDYGK